MGSAVETLCGQAFGAQKYGMLGIYHQRSAVLLTITGILLTLIYVFSEPILFFSRRIAGDFFGGRGLRVRFNPTNLRLRPEFSDTEVSSGAEHSRTECLHIDGHIGRPFAADLGGGVQNGARLQAFRGLPEFFGLSAASAVMLCLETWYFQILVLLAELLENPELALDSLSICLTISGWVFMISVGFNAAASVRVGNELGAGHPKSAAFAVVVIVTAYSFIISVAEAVSDLSPLLAATLILNGIQPVLSGVAVGCGWQAFVAYVNVGCYYVIGIPLGYLLGFYFKLGAKGIWSGMIGGTAMQTLILIWVTFRTDWEKEVDEARKRLDKWEDKKEPVLQ
ncbi:hypothetical protein V6N11_021205 [Hibiscus sabdariffa]|uniref:Uncharacterized protein n=1 Tax=Hibiscus sabdariffa TaxID=183260 RepID=A0ABR2NM30_9ROSI